MAIRVLEFKQDYSSGKPVDMVLIAPIGEQHQKTQTWWRVDKMRPKEDAQTTSRNADSVMAMEARWSVIGPAYDAWKSNSAIPETGTPLAAWSGVTADQAGFLKGMGMLTVEDVANGSVEAVAKLPFPDARKLPELAKAFLSSEGEAKKDKRIAEMEERMKVMAEMLESKMAEKPKRGRPPKAETESTTEDAA